MIRLIGTLATVVRALSCCLVLWSGAVAVQAQDDRAPDPHIRSAHANLLDVITTGLRRSTTMRDLVERIEASDLVVYMEWRVSPDSHVAAHTAFVSAAGGRRYLSVVVDPRLAPCQLLPLIAHELQHVAEIAGEGSVVSEQSLAAFYRRVGFSTGGWERERYESRAAIEAGERVTREMRETGSAASRAR